jgi:hypothetical protein
MKDNEENHGSREAAATTATLAKDDSGRQRTATALQHRERQRPEAIDFLLIARGYYKLI